MATLQAIAIERHRISDKQETNSSSYIQHPQSHQSHESDDSQWIRQVAVTNVEDIHVEDEDIDIEDEDIRIEFDHVTTTVLEIAEDDRRRILQRIPAFRLEGVKLTTCIFESGRIIIRYVSDNETEVPSREIVQSKLTSHINPPPGVTIRAEQLKQKPVFKRTSRQPGQEVKCEDGSNRRSVGTFVDVAGRGVHALVAGHGLERGQRLVYSNGNKTFGTVEVVCCSDDMVEGSCDAALVKLNGGFETSVPSDNNGELSLSTTTKHPTRGLMVQKFRSIDAPGPSVGGIIYDDYTSLEEPSLVARCFAVVTMTEQGVYDGEGAFHGEGESGIVVTAIPRNNGDADQVVNPVGMLVSTEFMEKTNDGRGYMLSLGLPLGRSLHQLSALPYCNNQPVTIVGVND